ncbi:hypothetical protein ACVWZ4_001154 [Bradyrhizobium sp. USDA 4472]
MLQSTPDEKQAIIDYMNWQAPDLIVELRRGNQDGRAHCLALIVTGC